MKDQQILSQSSYSSQDDDAPLLTDKVLEKTLSIYAKLKNKDQSIYKMNQSIYQEDDYNQTKISNQKKQPKFTYKDMIKEGEKQQQKVKTKYEHEAQMNSIKSNLKKKLKAQTEDEDNLFKIKKKEKNQRLQKTEKQKLQELTENFQTNTGRLLKDLWKSQQKLDQTDLFLKKYILDKKWLSKSVKNENNEKMVDEEDEERSVEMDEYEAQYNFRYQQPGGTKITQFPREIPESLRIKPETRKQKRKRQQQRKKKQEQQLRMEAETKKNEKKKEILQKLDDGIQEEGDVDHDWFFCDDCAKALEQNEEHYVCDECQDYMLCLECQQLIIHKHEMKISKVPKGFGPPSKDISEKMLQELKTCRNCRKKLPKYLKRFEYTDKSYMLNVLCERCHDESNLQIKKKYKQISPDVRDMNYEQLLENDPEKIKQIKTQKDIDELVDEYMKYDFEDVIGGGLKTKFKYVNVKPESYGLSDEQILYGDDKQLNKYVSIRRLAPYDNEQMRLRSNIYNKKVKDIDRTVNENKKIISKKGNSIRTLKKMQSRAQIMRKRRQNKKSKLKIINISNPENQKKYFVSNSRLASYGIASNVRIENEE